MNVLKKIVIPRTNVTIGYILMELEEMAREEFCRLKKVKENKNIDSNEREMNNQSTDTADHTTSFNNNSNNIAKLEKKAFVVNVETNGYMKPERETDVEINKFQIASSSKTSSIEIDFQEKMFHVKEYFEELVLRTKELIQKGDDSLETSKFLKKYENANKKLDYLLNEDDYAVLDKLLNRKMQHLKCHLREIIDVTNKEDKKQINSSSFADNNYQTKRKEYNQSIILPRDEKVEAKYEENVIKLQEFQDIISGVEKITAAYIKQGLLPPSMEAFVKSCDEMRSKINNYVKRDNTNNNNNKDLKQLVYGLEKNKSNLSKNTEIHNESASYYSSKLKGHTAELGENSLRSMETTKNNSIDDLINSFNKMECCVDKDYKNVQKFHHVQINLEEIINLIEKIKLEQKDSLERFFKASEDVAETKQTTNRSSSPLHFYNEDSTRQRKDDSTNSPQSEKLSIVERVIEQNVPNETIPCNFCKDFVNINESVIETICSICVHPREEEISTIISTHTLEKSEKNRCGLCKKIIEDKVVKDDVIKTKESEGTQTEVKNSSVPRLNLSCHYILSELEETEREDNFRLKRFKELKVKKAEGKEQSIITERIIEKEMCECTLSFETKELVDEFLYNDTNQEEIDPNTEFEELESNITEYKFNETAVDKEQCIICNGFEESLGKTNDPDDKTENRQEIQENQGKKFNETLFGRDETKSIKFFDHREITSPIESLLSTQGKDKEEQKTCPNCLQLKDKVKLDKINNYEENICPNSKKNEEFIKEEHISKDDNLCPSCKKKKSIEFIDIRNMLSQTEQLSLPNNVCPNCKKRKSTEFIDQRNFSSPIEIPKRIDLKIEDNESSEVKINKQDSKNNKYSDLEREKQNLCPSCKKENIKKSQTGLDPQKVPLQLGISKSLDNNNTDNKIKNMCPFCKNNKLKSRSADIDQNNFLQLIDNSEKKFDSMSKEKHVCPSCKNNNTKKDHNIPYKGVSTALSQNSTEFGRKTIDKHICPGCMPCDIKQDKNSKSDIDNNKFNMKYKKDNKVCPGCNFDDNYRKYFNKTNKKEIKESENVDYAHDQRSIEENESTKYCPACKTPAMKYYNTCDCGISDILSDIQISESDEYDKALSETCSLCERMRLSKTDRSSCSFKSNITNKQIHQTRTDNTSETVETINKIVKLKRLPGTDGIIREEITIKTRRTQEHVFPNSSDSDKYIKKPIEIPEKSIKQTKSENINQSKMNVSSRISSIPTKVSCLSSCSIPIFEKHSKSSSGEALHIISQSVPVSSQNLNSSQCNKTCMKNRYTESSNKSTTNCMICQNTEITESNVSLTKSCRASKCSKDMTKVKSNNNSCCKIKIINKDKNSKENSDEEEIELTLSTIVILKKILSYTSKSAASCCRSIETDQKQPQKSNDGSKAKVSSDINSVKSEPCMQKSIKELFDKKLRKTEPNCNTCDSKNVSKPQEDIPTKDRTLHCFSWSNKDLKPEKPKLDPSIKLKQSANIETHSEIHDKISSCKQENQKTIEEKTEKMKTDTNNCHESDKTKESKDNSSEIKDKEQTSKYVCNKTTTCENKSCQTRQQHHSRELKEKSESNKSIKTNSKCPHTEFCCTCKKKLENEVQKTCTCSKMKLISHTVNKTCTCMKAEPKSSKIVMNLSKGNCSCNEQTPHSVDISSSKRSNHSDSCTGSVETLSIANQTCLMDRLSDDINKKCGCLCLEKSNLKDITRETEKKLSCSKSMIAMQRDDSELCTCNKNISANGRIVEKKCSDINKSVSRECSCVSGIDAKKLEAEHPCACHQANNIHKSKETEIKKECQCQKHAHSKTNICSCQQLKTSNSSNKKQKPKCLCESSSKQSIHPIENRDTVSSGSQTCSKCLSTDQDLKLTNEVCSCTKHKPKHDGHNITNHRECSCSSIETALFDTVNSPKNYNCQAEKTPPSSYKQECSKTSDVEKTHSCKKTRELRQPCACSQTKSDTSKDHSQSSRISSKTCKDAQPQSKKSNKNHSRECSCRSSKNKIESDSEKSFDSFQSLVKTSCSCREHNPHKTNEKHHDVTNKTEETPPCSCHAADQKSGSCAKHQPYISKTETDTKYSCGSSENSFKPSVSFETEIGKVSLTGGSHKSQCTCKSKQNKENLKQTCLISKKEISKPCSCKETKPKMTKACTNEMAASPKCPCESSKQSPSIASNQSTEPISVGSQTCSYRCASIQTSQKSIRFSYDVSPTPKIKSDSTLPTDSSCSLKSCLSSQSQFSQCSCGKKEVSTSTKRSDRYDVRTLRDLPVEPKPKKLDCPCQSDSAVLKSKKPRNFNPVGKCCSLHDSHYFRY
ncbi:unnamed protein product, partial [Brenthis ino]